jgi:hypothetical protein
MKNKWNQRQRFSQTNWSNRFSEFPSLFSTTARAIRQSARPEGLIWQELPDFHLVKPINFRIASCILQWDEL